MGRNVPPFGAITIIINAKCKKFAKQEYNCPKLFFKTLTINTLTFIILVRYLQYSVYGSEENFIHNLREVK
jgi:hypothetical protein